MNEHSVTEGRTARLAGYLAGVAVVVGGLRRLGPTGTLGIGSEWLLTPLLFGAATVSYALSRPATPWLAIGAATRAYPALPVLVVADVLWAAVAVAWSSLPMRGLAEAARSIFTVGALALFFVLWRQERVARALCLPILVLGSVIGVLGVSASAASHWGVVSPFVEAAPHSELHGWARATGPAGTPATFAALMLGVAGVAFLARQAGVIGGTSWAACVAIVGASGVASVSIPGVGCVAVALWSLLAVRHRRLAVAIVVGTVLAATMAIYAHVHAVRVGRWTWERGAEAGYEPLGAEMHPLRTVQIGPYSAVWHWTGYARIHRAHLHTLADHPGGIGTGSFYRVDTGPTLRTNGRWARQGHPHAWVLMRGSEGGVVGLVIALSLWLVAGVTCVRSAFGAGADADADADASLRRAGLAIVAAMFLWASWFGDFLHRGDVALLVAGPLTERLRSSVKSSGIAAGSSSQAARHHAG